MSRRADDPDTLSQQLHAWAVKEMHFRPKGNHVNSRLPTPEDFKQICRGQVEIWKFFLDRVHSAQTVQKVRGNLALHAKQTKKGYKVGYLSGKKYSQEREELEEKRKRLVAELVNSRSTVGHLERDLERLHKDISTTGQSYEAAHHSMRDTQRRTALLEAFSQQTSEASEQYEEYVEQIRNRTKRLQAFSGGPTSEETYYSRGQLRNGDSEASRPLESACTRDVRESCEMIGSFLSQLLQGSFGTDKMVMAKRKESMWQSVEFILNSHSVHQVSLALCVHAQDTTLALRDKTATINIQRDAEALRFKYERSGVLSDVSTQPSLLQSMHQLLEENQAAQIQRFIQAEKSKNHVVKLQSRLSHAEEMMSQQLTKQHRGNAGALELARKLFETEVQLTTGRASLRILSDISQDLQSSIAKARQEKEVLYAKYRKIQDFKKLADNKQNLIRVLVKQNVSARPRLEEQQSEILKYVGHAMSSHCPDTRSVTSQLRDGVTREVSGFTALTLSNLMYSLLNSAYKVAVLDLSINRLKHSRADAKTIGGQTIQKLLHDLQFPPYKAPECLLPKVVALQGEIADIESVLSTQDALSRALDGRNTGHSSVVDHVAAVCQEIKEHDDHLLSTVLPTLQEHVSLATQCLADCLEIKDTAQHWWDQPGQSVTPWVKVDDLSLTQWRDKWTVAVTRLRQLQIQS